MAIYETVIHFRIEADSKEEAKTFLTEVVDTSFDLPDPPRVVGITDWPMVEEDDSIPSRPLGQR